MARLICTTCWRLPAVVETNYECPECDSMADSGLAAILPGGVLTSPRRRVRDLGHQSRLKRLVVGEEPELHCDRHRQASLRLYCPGCDGRLEETLRHPGGRPLFGIAGTKGAGKTLLTLTAVRMLRDFEVDGYRLSLRGLGDTEERYGTVSAGLFRDGGRPSMTEPEADEESLAKAENSLAWRLVAQPPLRNARAGFLTFYDAGGETWVTRPEQRRPRFDRYLAQTGALIFLVSGRGIARAVGIQVKDAWDQEPAAEAPDQQARDLLSRIHSRLGPLVAQTHLALTISKADCLWENEEWSDLEEAGAERRYELVAELLRRSGCGDLITLASEFASSDLFAVSSLGFRPRPHDLDAENRLMRQPQPRRVVEPVLHLLRQRQVI